MARYQITENDCFGLVHPILDAHTLGISSFEQLLNDCGISCTIADTEVCFAFSNPADPVSATKIIEWLYENNITALGFSYRLDPEDGADIFSCVLALLNRFKQFSLQGGPLRAIYFAGLPQACDIVKSQHPMVNGLFCGDETPSETLEILGINQKLLSSIVAGGVVYDDDRIAFGRELIKKGHHLAVKPIGHELYPEYGTVNDTLMARVNYRISGQLPPVIRAHVGPYGSERLNAVKQFMSWTQTLAKSGFLDVLSIGTSQLTQSNFGDDWGDLPNGGGVPINSPTEYEDVWKAARPMLVRTYAGTRHIPELARMHENTIHIAWHALSLWWFCQIDGRGPNTVYDNLREHVETLRYIASTGKPFEPNIPHHFAFRGADDVSYIVSAVIAARLAKRMGIRHFILQNMLNTPKYTWGVQDLAKSRAMLRLVRELQDDRFTVFLQPRGGLDYFSPDIEKAKTQLAAVTALMDDIEPHDMSSPHIIHVVNYSEASHLADPSVVNESIQITRHALDSYRTLRRRGMIDDMTNNQDVNERMETLLHEARTVLQAIETLIPDPYSVDGLYRIFAEGFLPVPYLWECREEFSQALKWQTKLVQGSVNIVDINGYPISAIERMCYIAQMRDKE